MTTQRGGEGTQAGSGGDDLPWWFKYIGRGCGITAAVVAVICGGCNCFFHFIDATAVGAGIVLIMVGVVALLGRARMIDLLFRLLLFPSSSSSPYLFTIFI